MDTECPICLESTPKLDIITNCCKHYFHKMCFETWLKKSRVCPYCRHICSPRFIGKYGRKKCVFILRNNNITIVYNKNQTKVLFFNEIKSFALMEHKMKLLVLKSEGKFKYKSCYINPKKDLEEFYNLFVRKLTECYNRYKSSLSMGNI